MGTAAVAVAAFRLPNQAGVVQSASAVVGWIFLGLALSGFVLLMVVNVVHHTPRRVLWRDVRSRERGPAYAAIPGAVLTLVLAFEAAVPSLPGSAAAGWILLGITLAVSAADVLLTLLLFAAAIANRTDIEHEALSGVWFMPQTVLLLAATTLARLSLAPHSSISEIAAPLAVLLLGAGFILFLLVGALVLGRLLSLPLSPADGIPAAWIMMSPAAAAALAFMALPLVVPTLMSASAQSVAFVTSLAAGVLVGFSLWWLMVVGLLSARLRAKAMAFSPASWSYVFPIAAVAVASGELAHTWDSRLMIWVATAMAVLAASVWVAIALSSVRWINARLSRSSGPGQ